ncbi:GNAT family N-acetyltransferase [Lignipirellula cremea]|uniref:GNAT family N-acetyltransferase n=1 Tax=Lignipirellula cremea TaxID=2528010 RepID=UPI0011A34B55|nr:GNAT family N-acetyltransferase [Lignipirellula cremea]
MHDSADVIVRSPGPGRQRAALLLAYRYLVGAQALEAAAGAFAAAEQGAFDLAGLVEAVRDGRLVGAALFQLTPGRTAAVHPPQLLAAEPETTAQRLLAWGEDFVRQRQATMLQAALATDAPLDAARFLTAGYAHAADLVFMGCATDYCLTPPRLPCDLQPYDGDRNRLGAVIEATYENTLDVPALDDLRDTPDVIDGYLATGQFRDDWWFYLVEQGVDVGCLLVNDFPDQHRGELVYMGLIPAVRGRGWGQLLTRQAQALVAAAGRPHLLLAVDAANQPAIQAYDASGFQPWETRAMYLKPLPSTSM